MNLEFEQSLSQKRRQLSPFMAKELLLDALEGRLDQTRQQAMEELLKQNQAIQQERGHILSALQYIQELSQITPTSELIEHVLNSKSGWAKLTDRLAWKNWPEVAKWCAEAVIIATSVAIILPFLPIKKISRWLPIPVREIILAEVNRQKIEVAPEAPSDTTIASQLAHPTPLVEDGVVAPPAHTSKNEVQQESLTPHEVKMPSSTTSPQDKNSHKKQFVYRAFMTSTKLEDTTPQVRNLIETLGGKKAGQVELGWHKGEGAYFHFSLPESNYEKLLSGLRTQGPVRIYKDPHWRVMPEGQIRIILNIENQKTP